MLPNSENITKVRNKFLVLSFLIWLIPFCARIPMNISYNDLSESGNIDNNALSTLYETLRTCSSSDAFILVFKNNIRTCIINVCGGVSLGICTVVNLAYNGFATSDMFVNSYKSGFPIADILKTTLPHSFELIGFWLSGTMGFMIAYQLVLFMKGREERLNAFIKQMVILAVIVFFTTLCAAYVETHISINML